MIIIYGLRDPDLFSDEIRWYLPLLSAVHNQQNYIFTLWQIRQLCTLAQWWN